MQTFLESEMRRTNRNLFVANVLVVVAIAAAAALGARYLSNLAAGPARVDGDFLAQVQDPDELERYYVEVACDGFVDSGARDVTAKTLNGAEVSREVTASYWLVLSDGCTFVAKLPSDAQPTATMTGALVELPADLRAGLLPRMKDAPAELRSGLRPFMLDATGFRAPGCWALAIGVPLLALAAWNLARWWARRANPASHPIVRELERAGSFADVATALELEVAASCMRFRRVRITRSWLLYSDLFRLRAIRLDDVLWAYKHVFRHLVAFIPVAKNVSLLVHARKRRILQFAISSKGADQLLAELGARIPWAALGFNPDLEKMWRKDRAGFEAAIEQRRRAHAAALAGPSAPAAHADVAVGSTSASVGP